jgi:D-alanyl-D-alanine carboxypeptidase (penicillin-binding protein 5/6)
MGSASEQSRASESQSLLSYGFRFFETVQLYRAGDRLTDVPVWKGETDVVDLGVAEPLFVTIPRGRYNDLDAELLLQETVVAPISAGQELGRVSISLDQEIVADLSLQAQADVVEAGFFGRTWDALVLWGEGLLGDD